MVCRSADKLEETKGGSVVLQDSTADADDNEEETVDDNQEDGGNEDAQGSSPHHSRASTTSQLIAECIDGGDKTDVQEGSGGVGDAKAADAASATRSGAASKPSPADSTIVQSYTYDLNFSPASADGGAKGPDLAVREVATDWQGAVFGEAARPEEDTTGMQV